MKFASALTALLVLLPAFAQAGPVLVARQNDNQRGRGGQNNNNNGQNNNNNGQNNNNNGQNNNNNGQNNNNNGQNNNNNGANQDPQVSLVLDPSQVQPNLAADGQAVADPGQVPSLTSVNNFINFCLTQGNVPLTNGQQVADGSCNPTPMGRIAAANRAPSSKMVFPKNLDVVPENQAFQIRMKIRNLAAGNFVNAQTNYFAAPQQVNGDGIIIAHSHVVVEQIASLFDTEPTNPQDFDFFKGLNAAANAQQELTADVTKGLPAGTYRLCSINTAANHQPVLVGVAQHGSFDDCSYFIVSNDPNALNQALAPVLGNNGNNNNGQDQNNNNNNGQDQNNNNNGQNNNNNGQNNNNNGQNNNNGNNVNTVAPPAATATTPPNVNFSVTNVPVAAPTPIAGTPAGTPAGNNGQGRNQRPGRNNNRNGRGRGRN
jgi:hypothetical protein